MSIKSMLRRYLGIISPTEEVTRLYQELLKQPKEDIQMSKEIKQKLNEEETLEFLSRVRNTAYNEEDTKI